MKSETRIRSFLNRDRRPVRAVLLVAALISTLVATSGTAAAAVGDISTYAGNGGIGCTGDGGLATDAQFSSLDPTGLATDSAGNVYVTDYSCHVVRRIDADTGIITTVAGSGAPGIGGDGGPATSAQLGNPNDVVVDSAGNLYIAQIMGQVVRRVDADTGIITTVAGTGAIGYSGDGGPGSSAMLWEPCCLAVDSAGNLYISEYQGSRVRRVDAQTGVITTVAGNGTRGFTGDGLPATNTALNTPYDVSVDPAGNLYILDLGNCRLRKVDAATGIISTVVGGNGCGPTVEGLPGTEAQMSNGSFYLTTDAAGNVYWADASDGVINKLDVTTGIVSRVAGNGTLGFSGDGGPATSAQLDEPYAIAFNGAGDLFIADAGNERVRRVEGVGTTVATLVVDIDETVNTDGTRGQVRGSITCEAGDRFLVELDDLTQGSSSASGRATGNCTGSSQRFVINFSNTGPSFSDGPGEACVSARTGQSGSRTLTDSTDVCEDVTIDVR